MKLQYAFEFLDNLCLDKTIPLWKVEA